MSKMAALGLLAIGGLVYAGAQFLPDDAPNDQWRAVGLAIDADPPRARKAMLAAMTTCIDAQEVPEILEARTVSAVAVTAMTTLRVAAVANNDIDAQKKFEKKMDDRISGFSVGDRMTMRRLHEITLGSKRRCVIGEMARRLL